MEILRRYAYGYATSKNMPEHLVEEAISSTFVKLVENISKYKSDKGEFRTWAITILRNELLSAARKDARINSHVEIRLDEATSDKKSRDSGELMMEKVLGYTYGVDDLIHAEEKMRFVAMAKLARRALKEYSTIVSGEPITLSIYDLCVQVYEKRDGVGWQSMAAREAGISKQVLSSRIIRARGKWQEWNGRLEA